MEKSLNRLETERRCTWSDSLERRFYKTIIFETLVIILEL